MDKRLLREQIRTIRDSISKEERAAFSRIIMDKVVSMAEFKAADNIMCFASFGSEVNTFPLLERIIIDNKTLILPRVVYNGADKYLDLFEVKDVEKQLVKGAYGIMEPDPQRCVKADASHVKLFICPGLAFDTNCNRLGYGAGFYDRLFEGIDKSCMKVGISFDVQIVDKVETDNFDIPMDKVITEKREITGIYERGNAD